MILKIIGKILVTPFLFPVFIFLLIGTHIVFVLGSSFYFGMALINGELSEFWDFYKDFCWKYPFWILEPIFK